MSDPNTFPADPGAYSLCIVRHKAGPIASLAVVETAENRTLALYAGDDAVDDLLRHARDEERTDPHSDHLPSDRAIILAALRDCGIEPDEEEHGPEGEALVIRDDGRIEINHRPTPAYVEERDDGWHYGFDNEESVLAATWPTREEAAQAAARAMTGPEGDDTPISAESLQASYDRDESAHDLLREAIAYAASLEATNAELLAALKALLACCELNLDDMEDDTRERIARATAAIAKAEG